jgi:hypothetical protein
MPHDVSRTRTVPDLYYAPDIYYVRYMKYPGNITFDFREYLPCMYMDISYLSTTN